jgi:hypothetical protein
MIYAGCDPGYTGAMAIIDQDGKYVSVLDWPGDERALVSVLTQEIDLLGWPELCLVEKQQSHGRATTGKTGIALGYNWGCWLTALAALGVPVMQALPTDWKKGLLPPKADKSASVAVASRMWPTAPLRGPRGGLLDGRAEALLLAHVCRTRYGRAL